MGMEYIGHVWPPVKINIKSSKKYKRRKAMKTQYVIGVPSKRFVRIYDAVYLLGCTQTLDEAKSVKPLIKKAKIYKLVEVKD